MTKHLSAHITPQARLNPLDSRNEAHQRNDSMLSEKNALSAFVTMHLTSASVLTNGFQGSSFRWLKGKKWYREVQNVSYRVHDFCSPACQSLGKIAAIVLPTHEWPSLPARESRGWAGTFCLSHSTIWISQHHICTFLVTLGMTFIFIALMSQPDLSSADIVIK